MDKDYLLKKDGSFVIKNYNLAHPFSNFLPGIAGEWGVPLWAFYVNRGQAISSFGIKDKNHSIAEFFPADKAYALTSSFGFRTFVKINKKTYYEPFQVNSSRGRQEEMLIQSSSLELKERGAYSGLEFKIKYFTLPNVSMGVLVRKVLIKNISGKRINLEVLDGLSRIIPFGSANPFLKDMSRTLEAWMRSYIEDNLATFRLIVDPRDVSRTQYIEGANFNYSFSSEDGKKVPAYMIVDPLAVFGQDTSYSFARDFSNKNFKIPLKQITCGKTPCAFSYFKKSLAAGQEHTFYNIFGSAFKQELIKKWTQEVCPSFLKEKEKENEAIVENIKNNAFCFSNSQRFNHYIKTTYLDNVLRGGIPWHPLNKGREGDCEPYYIYSRKHGDPERDYNNFQLLPSNFSEGEANYRDINQNRRMDLFFEPALKSKNIVYFFNLLKIDGYNPLIVKGEKLYFDKDEAEKLLAEFNLEDHKLSQLMIKGFYSGEFFELLGQSCQSRKEELIRAVLAKAKRRIQADFREGCWIDHWHYNLDLIESFLYFYPEQAEELFLSKDFTFWDDEHRVKKRVSRYTLRAGKVYQGESLEASKEKKMFLREKEEPKNILRTRTGEIYKTSFICKLLTLILNKAASLDPEGIGVEMEADKPGWCDSLNGLPALLGSSVCETIELKRAVLILLEAVKRIEKKGIKVIDAAEELFLFTEQIDSFLKAFLSSKEKNRDYAWWDKTNLIKEDFREKTFYCLEGREKEFSLEFLKQFLENLEIKLSICIKKAKDKKTGIHRAYFTYEVEKYELNQDKNIIPLKFKAKPLALFLEGAVHGMRIEGKKSLYDNLRKSELFDKQLKMYKLNASLEKESLEIGRSRIFVPGWLENESIWLHMEYKYLLELLKKGFYEEFFDNFHNCGVCFFDPVKYGRSILENSSFIVSSAYPDKDLWGKGFVARLSGATAELLNIWVLLCMGKKPFFIDKKGELCMGLAPILKKELFTKIKDTVIFEGEKIAIPKNTFSFKLFSKTLIVYHNPQRKDTFDKDCCIEKIKISNKGKEINVFSAVMKQPLSLAIRNKEAERIDIYLK
ncbi:MAG: cellobiose phosphorylase [Candidatus Omnitrophota bacterium]